MDTTLRSVPGSDVRYREHRRKLMRWCLYASAEQLCNSSYHSPVQTGWEFSEIRSEYIEKPKRLQLCTGSGTNSQLCQPRADRDVRLVWRRESGWPVLTGNRKQPPGILNHWENHADKYLWIRRYSEIRRVQPGKQNIQKRTSTGRFSCGDTGSAEIVPEQRYVYHGLRLWDCRGNGTASRASTGEWRRGADCFRGKSRIT